MLLVRYHRLYMHEVKSVWAGTIRVNNYKIGKINSADYLGKKFLTYN
jgi:hypothetical protein